MKKLWKEYIRPIAIFLSLVAIPILFDQGIISGRMEINEMLREGKGWIMLDSLPSRSYVSAYGATTQCMYFVYEKNNATDVDIYDVNGVYQCTFCFSDDNNGSAEIACVDNLAYVYLKKGDVYILSNTTIVEELSHDKAQELGYTYYWIIEQPKTLEINGTLLNIFDSEGHIVSQTQRPSGIILLSLPLDSFQFPSWIVYLAVIASLICLVFLGHLIFLGLK